MQLKRLKTLLLVTPIASLLMANQQCAGDAPAFKWNPKLYYGDARTQSMVREDDKGELEQVMCRDARFDKMICMDDFEIEKAKAAAFEVIDQCEKWKSQEAKEQADYYQGVILSLQ